MPSDEELAKWQRVRPIMNEILQDKGLVSVAEDKVLVAGLNGPLEEGWPQKVEAFVARLAHRSRPRLDASAVTAAQVNRRREILDAEGYLDECPTTGDWR